MQSENIVVRMGGATSNNNEGGASLQTANSGLNKSRLLNNTPILKIPASGAQEVFNVLTSNCNSDSPPVLTPELTPSSIVKTPPFSTFSATQTVCNSSSQNYNNQKITKVPISATLISPISPLQENDSANDNLFFPESIRVNATTTDLAGIVENTVLQEYTTAPSKVTNNNITIQSLNKTITTDENQVIGPISILNGSVVINSAPCTLVQTPPSSTECKVSSNNQLIQSLDSAFLNNDILDSLQNISSVNYEKNIKDKSPNENYSTQLTGTESSITTVHSPNQSCHSQLNVPLSPIIHTSVNAPILGSVQSVNVPASPETYGITTELLQSRFRSDVQNSVNNIQAQRFVQVPKNFQFGDTSTNGSDVFRFGAEQPNQPCQVRNNI